MQHEPCRCFSPSTGKSFRRSIGAVVILGVLVSPLVPASASQWENAKDLLGVADLSIQSLELPSGLPSSFEVVLVLGGSPRTLKLEQRSVRAKDFRLLVERDGLLGEETPPASRTFKGRVLESIGSDVTATLLDGELTAFVRLSPDEAYGIQPLPELEGAFAQSLHGIYNAIDVSLDQSCGVRQVLQTGSGLSSSGGGTTVAGTGIKICDLAIDSDVELYLQNGSSVEATLHDIESVIAGVDTIFERDLDIAYEVTTVIVRTSEPDPYAETDAFALWSEFSNHWIGTKSDIRRDIAHFLTGRDLDGTAFGFAGIGGVCHPSLGYGLTQSDFSPFTKRVVLTAHQIGHQWSAGHCDADPTCHIMKGVVTGDEEEFGDSSKATISAFRDSLGCLSDRSPPQALPFVEEFATTTLDLDRWSYNKGGEINSDALNEPSGPHSMDLNAESSGDYADDDLRSNFILLGGTPVASLSYATEHRGVESGEALIVEYWNDNLTWVEVNRIVSDGSDQSSFVQHRHTLFGDALHDRFRIRFRPDVDGGDDHWFVDDVMVDVGDCTLPVHYGNPTPGTNGVIPVLGYEGGLPTVGNVEFRLTASQLYGDQAAFLLVGFSQDVVNLGADAWLNVLPPWFMISFNTGGGPGEGQGSMSIPAPVPNDPTLEGVHFMVDVLANDPTSPNLGLIGTAGIDFEVCR